MTVDWGVKGFGVATARVPGRIRDSLGGLQVARFRV